MKASEAPKKIYLTPLLMEDGESIVRRCTFERQSDSQIEYTRTDAFIEKACDAYCAICDTKECDGCAECAWVIKFRRQLEKL